MRSVGTRKSSSRVSETIIEERGARQCDPKERKSAEKAVDIMFNV